MWRSNRDSGRVALRARTLIGGGTISEIPEKGGKRVAGLFPYNSYSEDAFLRTIHFCVKNEICTSVAAACKDIAGSDCGELPLCVIPASSCSEQNVLFHLQPVNIQSARLPLFHRSHSKDA